MGILNGKTAMIFGVANSHSIAWGIAQALHREGAQLALSYAGPALLRRVAPLAEQVGADFVEPCDLARDDDIETLFNKISTNLGKIDILIHSVAFANREELNGPYYATSREGFRIALDISCYSFTTLVRHALPLFNPGSSCLAMTYYGAEKAVQHYNVMGVAKAALEASVRYLAADLGPLSHRVNAISAGPIRTLAAAGVSGFKAMHREFKGLAPLQRNVTIEDVGNAAVYLCSNLASGVTGEVHHVDSGFNVLGLASTSGE
ncbi:MAG: enoyl-ACP reductase [Gammaproteobacteria bacterium]|nr:enoyl-ACP reductase [Gammaproteobacteria bacterium]